MNSIGIIKALLLAVLAFPSQTPPSAGPLAQSSAPESAGRNLREGPEYPTALPGTGDGWSLHILQTGGMVSNAKSDVTLNSLGKFSCTPSGNSCDAGRNTVPADALIPLAAAIAKLNASSLNPAPAQNPSPSLCSDCMTIGLSLWRRVSGDNVFYRATWDPTTGGAIPSDVLRIYDAVMALRRNLSNAAAPRP